MQREISTHDLAAALARVIGSRCEDIDPSVRNLRFCPTIEECSGPARSVVLRYHTYEWMANPIQQTHGGIVAAILDSSMGILASALYGVITPTITMTVNYARFVPLEAEVAVRVRAPFTGGTNAQMMAELYLPDEPELPLATATGVYYTVGAKK